MTEATPGPELPNALWDRRWRSAGQAGVSLVALSVFAVVVAPSWRWSLFLWGVGIGVAAGVLILATGHRATASDQITAAERLRFRRQLVVYAALWVFLGVMMGSTAAMLDHAWLDILLVAMVAVQALVVAMVATTMLRRRKG